MGNLNKKINRVCTVGEHGLGISTTTKIDRTASSVLPYLDLASCKGVLGVLHGSDLQGMLGVIPVARLLLPALPTLPGVFFGVVPTALPTLPGVFFGVVPPARISESTEFFRLGVFIDTFLDDLTEYGVGFPVADLASVVLLGVW